MKNSSALCKSRFPSGTRFRTESQPLAKARLWWQNGTGQGHSRFQHVSTVLGTCISLCSRMQAQHIVTCLLASVGYLINGSKIYQTLSSSLLLVPSLLTFGLPISILAPYLPSLLSFTNLPHVDSTPAGLEGEYCYLCLSSKLMIGPRSNS